VIVSNSFCNDTASIILNVFPVPTAIISGKDSICVGANTTLFANGGGTYLWNTGTTTNSININPSTNALYSVVVSNGICSDTTQTIITVNPLPIAAISGTNSICNGQMATLTASGGSLYYWSTGNNTNTISISPSINTTYSVIVSNVFGCQASAYSTLAVVPIPTVTIIGDSSICETDILTLTASGTGNLLWNTGEISSTITTIPANNTTFIVTASNVCGTSSDSISVLVKPLPTVTISNDTSILVDNSISLFANGGVSYNWLPIGLSCNTCSIVSNVPSATTVYTVTITDINGCTVTKLITVNVESDFDVFIPDIFSPNGDGQNDILYVRGIGVKELSFKVYDRLGEKIFETTDLTKGWDGTYKGTLLNNAVFVYELSVTLVNGNQINKHGDVTLIR
jgi:gliding motility-associated-like protein